MFREKLANARFKNYFSVENADFVRYLSDIFITKFICKEKKM